VEPGPPPVITRDGILLIYNGADDNLIYSTGWVLFDKHDPTKALAVPKNRYFRRNSNGKQLDRFLTWFSSKV
jgi:predicted GH43/DUF377 family glycosyl hydrolase